MTVIKMPRHSSVDTIRSIPNYTIKLTKYVVILCQTAPDCAILATAYLAVLTLYLYHLTVFVPSYRGGLTLIRESWKNSKTRDRHRARFPKKRSEQSIASIGICFCVMNLFPETALGDGPKNSRIRVNDHKEHL